MKMIVQYEDYKRPGHIDSSVELYWDDQDCDCYEFLERCRSLTLACGYYEDSWKRAILDLVDEYELMPQDNQDDEGCDCGHECDHE